MESIAPKRIASIDILRGIVMVIMALDHTRDFFHQPAMIADPINPDTTTVPIFFTRWITHFCAPTFVFLSGISAWLSSLKKTKREASLFLIKRGLWLVLIEVTVVSFGITFNTQFNFIIFQVIWAIGWSMVLLGIFSWIHKRLVLFLGLILFFGHNILDFVQLPQERTTATVWNIFFRASNTIIPVGNNLILGDFYAILPWTGVMLMGYSIGSWFNRDFPAEQRKKWLLYVGTGLIVLFIVLRTTSVYGNPFPWIKGEGFTYNLLSFLNTNKYPPSLLYLSMTLGPACILLALLENAKSKLTDIVSVYGKVPFFYYILHFYLLHSVLVIVFFATGHTSAEINSPFVPLAFRPPLFGYPLPVVYAIWLGAVALLYLPCKWFSQYKQTHKQWWLSYL